MALSWSEVENHPDFQALPKVEQEAARDQYFAEVVAPNVPTDDLLDVRAQFDADTRPTFGKSVKRVAGKMLDAVTPEAKPIPDVAIEQTLPAGDQTSFSPIQSDSNGRVTTTADRAMDIGVNKIIASHGVTGAQRDGKEEMRQFISGNDKILPEQTLQQASEGITKDAAKESPELYSLGLGPLGRFAPKRSLADTYADTAASFMSGVAGLSSTAG
jgi:hypothetical protein